MDSKKIIIPAILSGCTVGILLTGCMEPKSRQVPQTDIWSEDTTVYLREGMDKPSCKIYMELAYLKPASDHDSITAAVNSTIQQYAFGEKYARYPAPTFGKIIQNEYIKDYNTEVKKLFEADIHNGMKESDLPAWYNYEYEITSTLEMGRDSIWNYTVTDFSYTGGAHPNTQKKMLNIEATSGRLLHKEEVFRMDKQKNIEDLILQQLIAEANHRLDTDTITSIESLNEAGILLDEELHMPDNFLLGKDGVTFYYNRYEIAPYSSGDFTLKVPYEDIEAYMKK